MSCSLKMKLYRNIKAVEVSICQIGCFFAWRKSWKDISQLVFWNGARSDSLAQKLSSLVSLETFKTEVLSFVAASCWKVLKTSICAMEDLSLLTKEKTFFEKIMRVNMSVFVCISNLYKNRSATGNKLIKSSSLSGGMHHHAFRYLQLSLT